MKALSEINPQEIIDFLKTVDKKTWFKSGMIVASAVFLLVFGAGPAWFERPQLRARIKTMEGQILLTKTLVLKKPQLVKNKDEYTGWVAGTKSRLYAPGESSLLLGAISQLASQSKVSVVASMPKDSTSKFPVPFDASYEGKRYDFTVEGGYHDMGKFISQIESNAKLLRVESFILKSRAETPASHWAQISLAAVSRKKKLVPG